jgi:hypothetical protein
MDTFTAYYGQVLPKGLLVHVPKEGRFDVLWYIFKYTFSEFEPNPHSWFLQHDSSKPSPVFDNNELEKIYAVFKAYSQEYTTLVQDKPELEAISPPQIILDRDAGLLGGDDRYLLLVQSYHQALVDGKEVDKEYSITEEQARLYLDRVKDYQLYNNLWEHIPYY